MSNVVAPALAKAIEPLIGGELLNRMRVNQSLLTRPDKHHHTGYGDTLIAQLLGSDVRRCPDGHRSGKYRRP